MKKNAKPFMVLLLVPILIFGSSLASFAKHAEELEVSETIIQEGQDDTVVQTAKDKAEKDAKGTESENEKTNNGNGNGNGGNLGNGNTNNGSNDNTNNGNGNGSSNNNENNSNSTNNNGNGTGNGGNLGNGNTNNGNNDNTNNGNGNGKGGNGNNDNNTEKANGSVIVNHVDEQGEVIGDSETLTGKVDEEYTTASKEFPGYILLETPGNATGVFVEGEPTIVTYVYKELIGTLEVKHIDEKGVIIAEDAPQSKRVGTAYTTSPRQFGDYKLVKTPENAAGFYSNGVTVVIYEYEAIVGKVIVKHVNKIDNSVLDQETKTGRIGTEYATSSININNFVYDNSSAGQTTGTFTVEDIEVVYYYTPVTSVNNGGNNSGGNNNDDDVYFDFTPSVIITTQAPTDTILELEDTIIPLAFTEMVIEEEKEDKATSDIIVGDELYEEIELDVIPLGAADQLPKTGEIPAYLFYGMGLLATTLGVKLRRK